MAGLLLPLEGARGEYGGRIASSKEQKLLEILADSSSYTTLPIGEKLPVVCVDCRTAEDGSRILGAHLAGGAVEIAHQLVRGDSTILRSHFALEERGIQSHLHGPKCGALSLGWNFPLAAIYNPAPVRTAMKHLGLPAPRADELQQMGYRVRKVPRAYRTTTNLPVKEVYHGGLNPSVLVIARPGEVFTAQRRVIEETGTGAFAFAPWAAKEAAVRIAQWPEEVPLLEKFLLYYTVAALQRLAADGVQVYVA